MISFFILLPLNALLIWGFWLSCQFNGYEAFDALTRDQKKGYRESQTVEGKMILWFIRYNWNMGDKLAKPFYLCPICMSSLHGIIPYFYVFEIRLETILMYPFYVLTLAGLNGALSYKVFND